MRRSHMLRATTRSVELGIDGCSRSATRVDFGDEILLKGEIIVTPYF